jgi:hypothetical protein
LSYSLSGIQESSPEEITGMFPATTILSLRKILTRWITPDSLARPYASFSVTKTRPKGKKFSTSTGQQAKSLKSYTIQP